MPQNQRLLALLILGLPRQPPGVTWTSSRTVSSIIYVAASAAQPRGWQGTALGR